MANNNIKLSILICSIENEERQENLKKIIHELNNQICKNYAEKIVEVIVEKDNCLISVGEKRNSLISKSNGEYICFIDDDDFISENYLNLILQNLKKDILMIRINHLINGVKSKPIQTSLYIDYLETNEFIFRTNHFHLCPVKRVIADNIKFQKINFAEDLDFSQKIVPLIQSYDSIEEEIYIYNDNLHNSKTRNV
jgi:transcriptional regulator CtsR